MKSFKYVFLLSLCVFSSCILKKNEYNPAVTFEEKYTGEEKFPQPPGQDVDLACWWNQFDDPILNRLIDELYSDNFDLLIAFEKVEELRNLYRIEAGKLWPEINAGVSWKRSLRSNTLFVEEFLGPLYTSTYTIGLDASWEIDIFGRLRFGKKAAFHDFLASVENARAVSLTVVAELVNLYVGLRANQERIRVSEEYILALSELVHLADNRFTSGLTAQINLKEAISRMELKRADLTKFRKQWQETAYNLAVIVGKQPQELLELLSEKRPQLKPEGRVPLGMPSDLLRRRPDIRQAENEIEASKARIKVSKAELFPIFSLTADYGLQTQFLEKWFTSPSRTWSITPDLLGPVFRGGQLRANVRARNARQKQAALSYEKTVFNALKEVEDALFSYFEGSRRGDSLREDLASTTRIEQLVRDLFQSGLESLTPVLDRVTQVYESQDRLIQSEQIQMNDLIALYKSLGGGWECSYTP